MSNGSAGSFAAGGKGGAPGSAGAVGSAGSSSFSCEQLKPCGGILSGSWSLNTICEDVKQENAAFQAKPDTCPGTALRSSTTQNRSTTVFNSDGTYTSTGVVNSNVVVYYPTSCTSGLSCSQVAAAIASSAVWAAAP